MSYVTRVGQGIWLTEAVTLSINGARTVWQLPAVSQRALYFVPVQLPRTRLISIESCFAHLPVLSLQTYPVA